MLNIHESFGPTQTILYQSIEKNVIDKENQLTAANAILEGLGDAFIHKITRLSIEQIQAIRNRFLENKS